MSRKKESGGVQATIERLTGKSPCPEYLRNAANKYLSSPLFSDSHREKLTKQSKIAQPGAETLILNALALDEVFKGETDTVVKIIINEINQNELCAKLDNAEAEIKRRFETYGYWMQRIGSLRSVLLDNSIDLKAIRLDESLNSMSTDRPMTKPSSFALRAIQQLESIEERGRLGQPSVNELVEQADAYLALGDLAKAGKKARDAIEVDPTHARAWFVRVMAALQLRNSSLRAMQHHQMVSVEIAEPMSSQESWAIQMADEEANHAARHHEILNEILPQALLNWPRINARQFDHREQRTFVRNLFIENAFTSVISLSGREANGLTPEWVLMIEHNWGIDEIQRKNGVSKLPFNEIERTVLAQIVTERDKAGDFFFDPLDRHQLSKDFKLLHLRWMLKLDGYEQHWRELVRKVSEYPASYFNNNILCDGLLSQLWQAHQIINGDVSNVLSTLQKWQLKAATHSDNLCKAKLLHQYAFLFHRQFTRRCFTSCIEITRLAQTVASQPCDGYTSFTGSVPHPEDNGHSMPIQYIPYWRYLEALLIIEAILGGEGVGDQEIALLQEAETLSASFQKVSECFWTMHEEYEGGGGEDYEIAPYNVDLRETEHWRIAIEALLSILDKGTQFDDLKALAVRLAGESAYSIPEFSFVQVSAKNS